MINTIRKSKVTKVVASYLAIQLIVQMMQPMQLFALTGGPSQPEFNSFTPIGTSDMVNLSSGNFNYNIPIMDVGGYPLNLAYDSGVTMDQEASWVGLGWNLNVGQINRQLRGLPDDFNGDEVIVENNMRNNFTAGIDTGLRFPIFGVEFLNLSIGVGMKYNNYDGISFNTNYGASFNISDQVSAGINVSSSSEGDATVTPSLGLSAKFKDRGNRSDRGLNGGINVPFNSRQGLTGLNMSASANSTYTKIEGSVLNNSYSMSDHKVNGSVGGTISFNDNLSFTPVSQLSYLNANLTLNFGIGVELYGSEGVPVPQAQITGFGAIQALRNKDKHKVLNGYGYANSHNATTLNSLLDFNRENERTVTKNTTMLPIVNNTYDLFSINGQGIGGMFRPYKSQVDHVFDRTVSYTGIGGSAGFELGPGAGVHLGANVKVNPSYNRSGKWRNSDNKILNDFIVNTEDTTLPADYEPVYHKMIGELTADSNSQYNNIYQDRPIKVGIGGSEYNRKTEPHYWIKNRNADNTGSYEHSPSGTMKVQRANREIRNQNIQMIKYGDVNHHEDGQIRIDKLPQLDIEETSPTKKVPYDHYVGAKVLKPDGSTYVYGEVAYNTKKVEATFALPRNNSGDCITGLVGYNANVDNSRDNSNGTDHYFNRITTPAYAHTYLLSSVLSSDYEDLTNDGPTDDDLGAYTKFSYTEPQPYKWRVPFGNVASYNKGFNTDRGDDKGSYVYGEKNLKYVDTIETKTHIAIFELSAREDAKSSAGENGSIGAESMMRLNKIKLYSKPEYRKLGAQAEPIKTAHFEYSYELCKGVPNHATSGEGKLTLTKLYFTYRDSYMGKYTPYKFNYINSMQNENGEDIVFDYHIKGYDVWGNYKPVSGGCGYDDDPTPAEFPFVQQQDKDLQDKYAAAWYLESIDLPSGGNLEMSYETDDYQFVQDKKAMQMFKVAGIGNEPSSLPANDLDRLYTLSSDSYYLYVEIEDGTSTADFKSNYLGDIGDNGKNPMYFNFFLNITDGKNPPDFTKDYEYVRGYARIDKNASTAFTATDGKTYGAIKLVSEKREGGLISSNRQVNPISKAGWGFASKYLSRRAFGLPAPEIDEPGDLLALGRTFVSAIGAASSIFTGPNGYLRNLGSAKYFKPQRSWIRLYHPDGTKLGGGLRVKKIALQDNWDKMTLAENVDNPLYKNFYGQTYEYTDTDGNSSGVATFEPNGSRENPLVQPFYDKHEKLTAPKESNYVEKPIGESLFDFPTVTYSRVVVKNLKRTRIDDQTSEEVTLNKHATGEVVNEFYTSRNFPTISDFTDITPKVDITGILGSVLKVRTNKSLTYSQGFVVHKNDMNGKMKSVTVRSQGQKPDEFISKVEYKYATNDQNKLDNYLDVVQPDGSVSKELIGVSYDMVQDFRNTYNSSTVVGVDGNVAALLFFFGLLPVPTLLPVVQFHEQEMRSTTTTKVIHTTGILKEKIATDLGATVSTRNLAWDGTTGQVLLTETVNEYGDNYYNFNYPANWKYKNMGVASTNIGLNGIIEKDQDSEGYYGVFKLRSNQLDRVNASDFFIEGDELDIEYLKLTFGVSVITDKAWVTGYNPTNESVSLVDRLGQPYQFQPGKISLGSFNLSRSGYRNQQGASMASVTLQTNPIVQNNDGTSRLSDQDDWVDLRVVNSSAVEYTDAWDTQCEFQLPVGKDVFDADGNIMDQSSLGFNPYLYNVKGEWRAVKSYAYLTGRNNGTDGFNPRNEGFFNSFTPFYKYDNGEWTIHKDNWTFASQVTKYSPYGAELENRDALGRFSSAQYGYRYTLPTAVGSNSEYRQLGFDGFEDHEFTPISEEENEDNVNPHFSFVDAINANDKASFNSNTSHSGRYSVRINKGALDISKNLSPDLICEEENPCPNGNGDSGIITRLTDTSECSTTYIVQANCPQVQFNANVAQGSYIQFFNMSNAPIAIISQSESGAVGVPVNADFQIVITNCSSGNTNSGITSSITLTCDQDICSQTTFSHTSGNQQ